MSKTQRILGIPKSKRSCEAIGFVILEICSASTSRLASGRALLWYPDKGSQIPVISHLSQKMVTSDPANSSFFGLQANFNLRLSWPSPNKVLDLCMNDPYSMMNRNRGWSWSRWWLETTLAVLVDYLIHSLYHSMWLRMQRSGMVPTLNFCPDRSSNKAPK